MIDGRREEWRKVISVWRCGKNSFDVAESIYEMTKKFHLRKNTC
jgi:hypothetical protein